MLLFALRNSPNQTSTTLQYLMPGGAAGFRRPLPRGKHSSRSMRPDGASLINATNRSNPRLSGRRPATAPANAPAQTTLLSTPDRLPAFGPARPAPGLVPAVPAPRQFLRRAPQFPPARS